MCSNIVISLNYLFAWNVLIKIGRFRYQNRPLSCLPVLRLSTSCGIALALSHEHKCTASQVQFETDQVRGGFPICRSKFRLMTELYFVA